MPETVQMKYETTTALKLLGIDILAVYEAKMKCIADTGNEPRTVIIPDPKITLFGMSVQFSDVSEPMCVDFHE